MTQKTGSSAIEQLEPKAIWKLFAGMAAVPRASKKEEKIRVHMKKVAQELGFAVKEDAVGNQVIEVPAKPGCEKAPITVLQGHLDMVCEKNSGTQHDFDNEGIKTIIDKDPNGKPIVRADGTTLGADNGIGVCMALAAAADPDVKHGPLEILCTIDEEMGMTGAKALKPDFFKGKRMLNLDSEEDTAIYIGCAGGCDSNLTWSFAMQAAPAGTAAYKVAVTGLRGGHSGGDIHQNRGNAIKFLVQTLRGVDGVQVAELNGGSKRNAIPREAYAVVIAPTAAADKLANSAQAAQKDAIEGANEANCIIKVEKADAKNAASIADSRQLLTTLAALPHGVLAVVPTIAGLVQTSNSTSIVESKIDGGKLGVTIMCLSRSSAAVDIETVKRQIRAIGDLGGAKVEQGNEYPGWAPDVDSPTLATCRRVYEKLFGEPANVTAIHAGLECGIIGQRMGKMDMVSFGPHIEGAHSPDERIWVESVQKSWKYLKAVLAELAKA